MEEKRLLSKTTIASLAIFYFVFVFLISLLFWFLIQDVASGDSTRFREGIAAFGFGLFSATLIFFIAGTIIGVIVHLARLKRRNPFVGGIKLRLVLFFSGFSFVISIPQVVLAILLVISTSNLWITSNTEQVLQDSRDSLVASQEEQNESLHSVSKSSLFHAELRKLVLFPEQRQNLWKEIQAFNPIVSAIQLYTLDGKEIFMVGDPLCSIPFNEVLLEMKDEEFPLTIYKDQYLFRYVQTMQIERESYKVITSGIKPERERLLISDLDNLFNHYQPLIESREWIRGNIALIFLLFVLIVNLVSIYISLYLGNSIISPISDLQKAITRVSEGEFSVRLYSKQNSSFRSLFEAFNKMSHDLEELQVNSTYHNKMKAWQDIARQMAHEINNPLTPIQLSAERMLRQYARDPEHFEPVLKKSANAIISEVANLQKLLQDFRTFSKLPEPNWGKVDLKRLLEKEATIYENQKEEKVHIDLSGVSEKIVLKADESQLRQVFSNLFKNSIEAMSLGGEIHVETTLVSMQNIKYCRITLSDNGRGMSQEVLENLFAPYFTTKSTGTGLGLAIVERIIFTHKGQIKVRSKEGKGTVFIIDLPVEDRDE